MRLRLSLAPILSQISLAISGVKLLGRPIGVTLVSGIRFPEALG